MGLRSPSTHGRRDPSPAPRSDGELVTGSQRRSLAGPRAPAPEYLVGRRCLFPCPYRERRTFLRVSRIFLDIQGPTEDEAVRGIVGSLGVILPKVAGLLILFRVPPCAGGRSGRRQSLRVLTWGSRTTGALVRPGGGTRKTPKDTETTGKPRPRLFARKLDGRLTRSGPQPTALLLPRSTPPGPLGREGRGSSVWVRVTRVGGWRGGGEGRGRGRALSGRGRDDRGECAGEGEAPAHSPVRGVTNPNFDTWVKPARATESTH